MHAGENLDQRRLAGAVVADQRDDLAGMHVEFDVGQRRHRAEMLGDAAQAQHQVAVGGVARTASASWLHLLRYDERARPAASRPGRYVGSTSLRDAELLAAFGIAAGAQLRRRFAMLLVDDLRLDVLAP